jgi:hypothetical protein
MLLPLKINTYLISIMNPSLNYREIYCADVNYAHVISDSFLTSDAVI